MNPLDHFFSRHLWAGIVLGLLAGMLSGYRLRERELKPEERPAWSTRLEFVGSEPAAGATRFYLKNLDGDYRPVPGMELQLFKCTALGLVAESSRLVLPAYFPAKETASLTLTGEVDGTLVLFDVGNKIRVELGGRP